MCSISLNMHILWALSKFKIFIIKIQNNSLYISLVWNAVFITVYHDKVVRDDISAKTIPIWLHHTIYYGRCILRGEALPCPLTKMVFCNLFWFCTLEIVAPKRYFLCSIDNPEGEALYPLLVLYQLCHVNYVLHTKIAKRTMNLVPCKKWLVQCTFVQ